MLRSQKEFLNQLSTADMKKLLEARERIDVLEAEKAKLMAALAKVDQELDDLMAGLEMGAERPRKKVARKKTARKKTTKKAVKKATAKRKVARKPATTGGRVKLEDVVVTVLQQNGGTMSFKDIFSAIVKDKLFKTKSKNFDNVLRRTLSTTKKVQRAGRGVYTLS